MFRPPTSIVIPFSARCQVASFMGSTSCRVKDDGDTSHALIRSVPRAIAWCIMINVSYQNSADHSTVTITRRASVLAISETGPNH